MKSGDLAAALGKGLVAGCVGTAAMTVSSTIEAKLRSREGSTAPADAAAKVLGIEPVGEKEKARFSTLVHWSYGTGWGALRGVFGAVGIPVPGLVHYGSVWGSELVMLPALEVAPPLKEWEPVEIAIDALHHAVYAAATSIAFRFLDRHTGRT